MSVSAVSHTTNASYPKNLESKKYAGALLAVSSGTLGASIAALNLSKSPVAKKNPLLLGIGAIVSMLGGIIGLTQACNAVKEMQKYSWLVV